MGILTRMLTPAALPHEQRSGTNLAALEALIGNSASASGRVVSAESALRVSAVMACVRVIAETIAALPLPVYRRRPDGGKDRATEHPLYTLLHDLPNPEMTSMELRENLLGHLCLWGNAYCEVEFDGAGRRRALWPLRPDRVEVLLPETPGGARSYLVSLPNGQKVRLQRYQVWHIRGYGTDASQGLSPIAMAREAIGLAMATEEHGARLFSNGARPGGVLEHPSKLTDASYERMKKSWNEAHGGLDNAHRVAILEEGVKWQSIGIPPNEAQFLETRQFQAEEIARTFRVPQHKIGLLTHATFSNIEHQGLEFVTDTVLPWCVRIEKSIFRDLLAPNERKTYFAEHLLLGLLRGDQQSRYNAYATGRQWGWLCADDVREAENLNPLPDGQGKMYLVPMNMTPADQVGEAASADQASSSAPDGPQSPVPAAGGEGRNLAVRPSPRGPSTAPVIMTGSAQDAEERRMERRDVAGGRKRLAVTFRPTLQHVATRVTNREVNDLQNARKKYTGDPDGFRRWLEEWAKTHEEFVREYIQAPMASYAGLVLADVERELGRDVPAGEVDPFTQGYISGRAEAWIARLKRSVLDLTEAEDWEEEVDDYLTQRKETQPARWADEEAFRMANALARVAYDVAAVAMMMWLATGETCPYCLEFDGQQIPVREYFLPAGQELAPEGQAVFQSDSDVGHPPLHHGCDCVLVAV